MPKSKTAAARMQAAERKKKAVHLRRAGYTQREIAEQIGVSVGRVCKILQEALSEYAAETAQEVSELKRTELARLDAALRGIWPRVVSGNLGAIDRMIKIMERRAKLMALDGPDKIAPTDPTGEKPYDPPAITDDERAQRILEILERSRAG